MAAAGASPNRSGWAACSRRLAVRVLLVMCVRSGLPEADPVDLHDRIRACASGAIAFRRNIARPGLVLDLAGQQDEFRAFGNPFRGLPELLSVEEELVSGRSPEQ